MEKYRAHYVPERPFWKQAFASTTRLCFFFPKLAVSFSGSQLKGLQLSVLESTLGSHYLGKLPYAQSRCVETAILLGTQWVVIPIP